MKCPKCNSRWIDEEIGRTKIIGICIDCEYKGNLEEFMDDEVL